MIETAPPASRPRRAPPDWCAQAAQRLAELVRAGRAEAVQRDVADLAGEHLAGHLARGDLGASDRDVERAACATQGQRDLGPRIASYLADLGLEVGPVHAHPIDGKHDIPGLQAARPSR